MASGSLPPGFPATVIAGAHYWDGALVSNSPLWYVFEEAPRIRGLIVQVDLFSAKGELPTNLDQVLERAKDIQYSSKTRFNTKQVQEIEGFRLAVGRLLRKLPATLHDDPDYKLLQPLAEYKPRHHRASDQPTPRQFYKFQGFRILAGDRPTALGGRTRGRAACGLPSGLAEGTRTRRWGASVRSRRLNQETGL
jgi:predicted acylesterase/phospholipase RssA